MERQSVSLKILLVEKDPVVADLLVPGLERKGHQVTVARTQRQTTSQTRSGKPDLLVVDIPSFGSNGYRVCEAIRARLEGVPTILLLDHGHSSAGSTADAYMTPPFTSRKLLYRVGKLAETLGSREIRVGPLALDPDSRILRKGDVSCYLRPKEAQLLAQFMRNPGKVLTRRQLMRDVWDTEYMGDTRTLSVHVRWVRLKIEDDPSNPRFLTTVRGVGYRFAVPGPD